MYDGDYACERLAMSQADDDAQAEADQLVEAAGGIHPLTGFAMGLLAGGDLRAVLEVEDADDAPDDAEARARLAAGPAPGQGGDFSDRFSVEGAGSEGRAITLDLRPEEGSTCSRTSRADRCSSRPAERGAVSPAAGAG